ncbi:protein CLEC16A-like [Watersipora subatra]|uniref:protein CLEC16A-like n=1 Tax=Watersipora subatra TaxID=2589382 RepID=UPI00355BC64B
MFKKSFFGSSKPKNALSLENLKYLYNVLVRHQTVTESNRALLVETLRSITEIVIWGDQNDSTIFDYFLEKNMLGFFTQYLSQKSGQFIAVQALQTLNILFENINNKTSIYFLLSNNYVNSIITHKFDFTDEEVMAYYISFMKTLSLKLDSHTIHFFFNELSLDFPLYTHAIRFFNHSESMVRIAVRTITLNVYQVDAPKMQAFIRERTCVAYFSNLVWYMGNHVLEVDSCMRNDIDHKSKDRLADLVAEHLDHLHYLNDILELNIEPLNNILTDYLLQRLYVPLYVRSLAPHSFVQSSSPQITRVLALSLLAQVFLIIHHQPLVRRLLSLLLAPYDDEHSSTLADSALHPTVARFVAPAMSLVDDYMRLGEAPPHVDSLSQSTLVSKPELDTASNPSSETQVTPVESDHIITEPVSNTTDDEKIEQEAEQSSHTLLSSRSYIAAIFSSLDAVDGDFTALLALCLLYAIGENSGINQELLDSINLNTRLSSRKDNYNEQIVDKLIKIITLSSQFAGKVRLATLELAMLVLKSLVLKEDGTSCLRDHHLANLISTKEESMALLRNVFKSEEMFLDMFEDEYREMSKRKINVEFLTMEASILLPPTNTPLTGIKFTQRLPCGEVERVRKAIRVYLHIRDLLQQLNGEEEAQLPLTKSSDCVKIGDVLDLNNSDLIGCTVIKENTTKKERRFLVIDVTQLIMVEPDASRLGWGVVRFSGYLQDVEVTGDRDDSRCLHISLHKPASSHLAKPISLLTARFLFDDHIRCVAAKQRLTKGRAKARQRKMMVIASMLDISSAEANAMFQPSSALSSMFSSASRPVPGRITQVANRPRSMAFSDSPAKQGLDVSKSGVYQVLNSSGGQDSSKKNSETSGTSVDVDVLSIPMKDLSHNSKQPTMNQSKPSSTAHASTEQTSTSSTVRPVSNTVESSNNSSLITPFGSGFGELRDV